MSNKIWYFVLGCIFVVFASNSEANPRNPHEIDCTNSKDCEVEIGKAIESRMKEVGIDHEDLGYLLEQASYDIKNGLVNSKAYQAINYIFYFKGFDEGSTIIMDALVDFKLSGGAFQYIPGIGPIPMGGDPGTLFNKKTLEGAGKVGLFALSLIPGTKLIGSAFKGLKFLALGKAAVQTAESGLLTYAERQALAAEITRLGEKKLAEDVARKASARKIQQALALAAESQFQNVRGWALRVAPVALVGIGLPAYPASLAAPDIARFVLTQGCALAADSHTNPTTNALRLTGTKAERAIESVIAGIREKYSDRSTGEALSAAFVTCEECKSKALPVEQVNSLSDRQALEKISVQVDTSTNKLVFGSL